MYGAYVHTCNNDINIIASIKISVKNKAICNNKKKEYMSSTIVLAKVIIGLHGVQICKNNVNDETVLVLCV